MLHYLVSPTGVQFHESDQFVKMLVGPYGSGKSCACAVDVLTYACAQAPAPDGYRYSNVGVIRATYPELSSTTRRSLLEVLPKEYGTITSGGAPLKGFYKIPLPDGTTVHLELNLLALQTADDAQKILSANFSYAWINEATGVSPEIFNMVLTRIGRYPSLDMGGVSWGGIIMDFNQPARGSWLYDLMNNLPDNYALFKQPPAAFQEEDEYGKKTYWVNPDAENLRNLGSRQEGDPDTFATEEEYDAYLIEKGKRYYHSQIDSLIRSGREDVVQNQYCMIDVPVVDGKPVYTNFSLARHVARDPIVPALFQPIIIGLDQSGIHPAAVILQNQQGKWCVLDEMYADGEGLEVFLQGILIPKLRASYATSDVIAAIDPSNTKDSWTATTPKTRLEEAGIPAVTEITNSPKLRIQVVEHMLNLDTGGLFISPTCELLTRGFQSEYRYRRLRASGSIGAAYTPTPEKNEASHLQDALQYACLLIQQGRQTDDDRHHDLARRLSDRRAILRRAV